MSDIKRVILFGGQGSSSLFSSQGALAATNDVKSSVAAAILLSKCHAAFLEEVQGLGIARSEVFGDECDFFNSPEKLLAPDATYHDNPIIQGTTICLYQLLRYLANVRGSELEFKSAFQKILETAGFCSGILPAAVVASSRTVQEYVDFGVEAFRLAFWTGYRSTLYCQKILGRRWKELPWSLVVMGLNEDQMLAKVEDFHNQV